MYNQASAIEDNNPKRLKDSIIPDRARRRANLPYRKAYVTHSKPNQSLRVWPFVFIFFAGTGAYVYMVKTRASELQKSRGPSVTPK